ncbi:MAG: histidine phosphatase family protein [Pseudomonadota bacterium]
MPLTLLRHTQPAVAEGLCYGRTDLDVADNFAVQAAAASARLPAIDLLLSSPARRCRKLAEYIGEAHQMPVQLEPRLLELDFGRWEQQFWADIPRSELDAWGADLLHANPYQGETVAELNARIAQLLLELACEPGHIVWVTHAGVIKSTAAHMHGDQASFDWTLSVKFADMITFPSIRPSESERTQQG